MQDFQWIVTENSSQPTSVLPVRRLQSQPFDVDIYVEDLTHWTHISKEIEPKRCNIYM